MTTAQTAEQLGITIIIPVRVKLGEADPLKRCVSQQWTEYFQQGVEAVGLANSG
jgi:hypothetical protein